MGKNASDRSLKQVAALPTRVEPDGELLVLLMTSRETRRAVIPKGWPMKGLKDHEAAAVEAREEAGLLGRVSRKPIGAYSYWKRRVDGSQFLTVDVFLMEVTQQLDDWKEKGQRQCMWLSLTAAAELTDEPSLAALIRGLQREPVIAR